MSDVQKYPSGGNGVAEKGATAIPDEHLEDDFTTSLAIDGRKLLRKLDRKLLPALTLLYLLSFLDRSNGKVLFEGNGSRALTLTSGQRARRAYDNVSPYE